MIYVSVNRFFVPVPCRETDFTNFNLVLKMGAGYSVPIDIISPGWLLVTSGSRIGPIGTKSEYLAGTLVY